MPIIHQRVKGKTVKYLDINATAGDLTELNSLLEGEITTFDLKSTGGTATATPPSLNRKKFSCGDRDLKISCSFTVPHVKLTAHTPDIESVVVGAFDASFESANKCDYMNLLYDRN